MTLEIPQARMGVSRCGARRFPGGVELRCLRQKRIALRIQRLVLLLTPSRYQHMLKRNTPLCVWYFFRHTCVKNQTGLGIKNAMERFIDPGNQVAIDEQLLAQQSGEIGQTPAKASAICRPISLRHLLPSLNQRLQFLRHRFD